MANLLYITCNLVPQEQSNSLSLGYEFLKEYLRCNPAVEVQTLDLYRDTIQRFDIDIHNALARITQGGEYGLLSYDEQPKVVRMLQLADQFCTCDKYVFVTNSLNLWFPAEFKMYIDAICIPNVTLRLTSHGVKGMLPGEPKKSLHIHTTPLCGEDDLSVAYLTSILKFFGVIDHMTLLLNGDDIKKETTNDYTRARRKLLELAHHF